MKELSKLEETVLVVVWRLGENAYGVTVKKKIHEITGKNYFYNTVYTAFEQLLRKGFITKHFGEPTAVRGGKRKVYFQITEEGLEALEHAFKRQNKIWYGISQDSFRKGFAR